MQKITLPLVMIASLATLVSCGQTTTITPNISPAKTPVVTGMVVTPTATMSVTPVVTATASQTPAIPVVVLTRKEIVSYNTPEGTVPVEFDVTVTDGIITATSAKTLATTDASTYNQDKFVKEVGTRVIGKKAKDLHIDAIGGASLTTAAFETFVHSF